MYFHHSHAVNLSEFIKSFILLISEAAEQGSTAQSSHYPLENDDDDLEYDMLNMSDDHGTATEPHQASFEESGTKSNKKWSRKGDPSNNSKKECVIS